MKKQTGIYQIINTANGWVYIGSTRNLHTRLKTHINQLRTNFRYTNNQMQRDANVFGISVFICTILEILPPTSTDDEIFQREKLYTEIAHQRGKCYNPKYPRSRAQCSIRTCSLCNKRHHLRGMCDVHYRKWRSMVRKGVDIDAEDYIKLQLRKEG